MTDSNLLDRQKVEEKMTTLERSWQNERSLRLQVGAHNSRPLFWENKYVACGLHLVVCRISVFQQDLLIILFSYFGGDTPILRVCVC